MFIPGVGTILGGVVGGLLGGLSVGTVGAVAGAEIVNYSESKKAHKVNTTVIAEEHK